MRCQKSAKTSTHRTLSTAESDEAKVSRQQQQPGVKIKADILVVAEWRHIQVDVDGRNRGDISSEGGNGPTG